MLENNLSDKMSGLLAKLSSTSLLNKEGKHCLEHNLCQNAGRGPRGDSQTERSPRKEDPTAQDQPKEYAGPTEMKALEQGVREYKELVKKKYSIDITQGEAEQQFKDLLALFRVIYRPMTKFDGDSFSQYNGSNDNE